MIIPLKNILNNADKDYFSEITISFFRPENSGDFMNNGKIPANLRCRMMFDCITDAVETGRRNENIEVIIPSAKTMIQQILSQDFLSDNSVDDIITEEDGSFAVSLEVWKALVFYHNVFLGAQRNNPINFSLGFGDAISRLQNRFNVFLRRAITERQNGYNYLFLTQTLSWLSK